MKALVYNFAKKKFLFKEIPLPKVKEKEILIKVKRSALCGTDLPIIKGPLTKKVYNKKEIILGHSFSGVVAKVGKRAKEFKKGERVFASSFVWCGKCPECLRGRENLCDNRFVFGMEIPGSHAEYVSAPKRVVFPLPSNIDFNEGSLISDVLALDIHALNKAQIKPGDKTLILGAGPIGLTLGILLKSLKIKSIFVSELIKERQNLAKKLFNPQIVLEKELKNFRSYFDIVFETSGDIKALERGLKLLKRGGKMITIGVQSKNLSLDVLKLISREISLLGIFEFTLKDIKKSLELLKKRKISLKKIITHQFSLFDGKRAYQLLKLKKCGKIILEI
jgi:2-desacetyl-2-hydroxyethyl bacteriochlorophyllide A dehydrogenase